MLKGHLMSWNRFNRLDQLTLILFRICSLIFTFQRHRDLDSDPSSLVLSSGWKPWMKGLISLIFPRKQDLQKMIHPKFWITLVKCLTDCSRNSDVHLCEINVYRYIPLCSPVLLLLPGNLIPSHKTSCLFSCTKGNLWSLSVSSKLFSLTLPVFRQFSIQCSLWVARKKNIVLLLCWQISYHFKV